MTPIPRGSVRIDLTDHINSLGSVNFEARLAIRAWVPKGSDLGALINLGAAQYVHDEIVVWLAEATFHAVSVDIVGDDPKAVAQLVRDLPPAYRLVQSWNEAA